jgi:hypothetical protein
MTPMAQVRLTSLRIPEGRPLWLLPVMLDRLSVKQPLEIWSMS